MPHRVCYVAGKSGGHIIPALTLASQHPDDTPLFFCNNTALDHRIINQSTTKVKRIALKVDTISWRNPVTMIKNCWQLTYALITSFIYLYRYQPEKVVSMGGLVSIPVCTAAWLLRIPYELYELNAEPGKAVNFLASRATRIHCCFQKAQYHFMGLAAQHSSYPVKFTENDIQLPKDARKQLGLQSDIPTVLILGGSQGSVSLNSAIKQWLIQYNQPIQVIHQTGSIDSFNWPNFYKEQSIPAIVFDYCNDLCAAYNAANLIICRSGAGTLFEILFFKKPCITIPLKTTTTAHQVSNAYALAQEYPELICVIEHEQLNQTSFNHLISFVQQKNIC